MKLKDYGLKALSKKGMTKRDKSHARQRKEWGFCDEDLWNLSTTIAKFILPRLKRFRKMPRMGYPGSLTEKQWDKKLGRMIAAFKVLAHDDNIIDDEQMVDRGLDLFRQWFNHLWD